MTTTRKNTTKPADDEPFDFNLDAVEAEVDLRPWRVNYQGRRWTFAHMQSLDAWDVIEAAEAGDTQAIVASMRLALGDEQFAEFRKLPLPGFKLMPLFNAWQKHCGMEPGESEASAGS